MSISIPLHFNLIWSGCFFGKPEFGALQFQVFKKKEIKRERTHSSKDESHGKNPFRLVEKRASSEIQIIKLLLMMKLPDELFFVPKI